MKDQISSLVKLLIDNGYTIDPHGVIRKPDKVTGLPVSLGKIDLSHVSRGKPLVGLEIPIPFCSKRELLPSQKEWY